MLRRLSGFSGAGVASLACSAATAQQMRSIYWFSNSSPTLERIQQEKSYTSDLWVEEGERRFRGFELKEGEGPHAARLTKQLELYNMDEIVVPADVIESLPAVEHHSSFVTQRPYGETLKFELQNRAELKGYKSKWWLTPPTVRKRGFQVQNARQSSTVVLIETNTSVFNADQLKDPSQVNTLPLSAGTRRVFVGEKRGTVNSGFQEHQKANNFPSCVYFSQHQAETIGLHPAEDAVAFETSFSGGKSNNEFVLYNASCLNNWEELSEGRMTAFATFFTPSGPGNPIKSESVRNAIESAPSYPTNYWTTTRDIKKYGWSLKEGMEDQKLDLSSITGRPSDANIRFFNVDQFADPAKARASIGTLVR